MGIRLGPVPFRLGLHPVEASLLAFVMVLGLAASVSMSSGMPQTRTDFQRPIFYQGMTDKPLDTFLGEVVPFNPDYVARAYLRWDGKNFNPDLLRSYVTALKNRVPSVLVGYCESGGFVASDFTWPDGHQVSQAEMDSWLLRGPNGETVPSGYIGYITDIRIAGFQQYLLTWSQALLNAGADVIDYDLPYFAAYTMITKWGYDQNTIMSAYDTAWTSIYSQTKQMGAKYVAIHNGERYVVMQVGDLHPMGDFAYVTVNTDDVKGFTFGSSSEWSQVKSWGEARQMQVIPMFDYGFTSKMGLPVFASHSTADQIRYLNILHDESAAVGMKFLYPVHGGALGSGQGNYDSVQYGTYVTMVSLVTGAPSATTSTSTPVPISGGRRIPAFGVEAIVAGLVVGLVIIAVGRRAHR